MKDKALALADFGKHFVHLLPMICTFKDLKRELGGQNPSVIINKERKPLGSI